jgi:long-subunit fatty acid transport protein
LILNTSYSKTSYSNSLGDVASSTGLSFSGNETYQVNLGGTHEWSKRLSLSEKLLFSNTQYTGSNALIQNLFGFQLGANYKINPNWEVSAGGGPMWVDTQQSSNGATSGQNLPLSLGSIANISLSYSNQLTQFSTGFSNTLNPSAIGQTLQTSSIFANYSYRLTQRLLLGITSNYSSSESIGGQSSDTPTNQFDRSYYTVAPSITWDFAKNWLLKGSYTYSWQDYQQDNNFQILNDRNFNNGTVDSNVVMFSLGYSWDGVRISR